MKKLTHENMNCKVERDYDPRLDARVTMNDTSNFLKTADQLTILVFPLS